MPETREFERVQCFRWRCAHSVSWIVYDNDTREYPEDWVLACDQHKMEAFS